MKEFFEVSNQIYTQSDVSVNDPVKGWIPARPALYSPSLIDRFNHWRGKHWSYGQYFCIICGKERVKLTKDQS